MMDEVTEGSVAMLRREALARLRVLDRTTRLPLSGHEKDRSSEDADVMARILRAWTVHGAYRALVAEPVVARARVTYFEELVPSMPTRRSVPRDEEARFLLAVAATACKSDQFGPLDTRFLREGLTLLVATLDVAAGCGVRVRDQSGVTGAAEAEITALVRAAEAEPVDLDELYAIALDISKVLKSVGPPPDDARDIRGAARLRLRDLVPRHAAKRIRR